VNEPKSYCVQCRFRRQSVRLAGARGKFHPWAATPHGSVETASAPICKSQTGYLYGHVFKPDLAIFPGIPPFYSICKREARFRTRDNRYRRLTPESRTGCISC